MWRPIPGVDYTKYYGGNIQVYYDTINIKYNEKENTVTNGVLLEIVNRPSGATVILLLKSNINQKYDIRISIFGELIHKIKIEDKDMYIRI